MARFEAGEISSSEYDLIRLCLDYFRGWFGAQIPIDKLDSDRWEDYWSHLLGCGKSQEYKKKRYRHARNFVDWAASKGLLTPPANLHSRRHRFGNAARVVPTMTIDEVRTLVRQASERLRLHLMLMINTGMTQVDISDLKWGDVNWQEGRIIRKRSKTEEHHNVPTVNYLLWPETSALLQKFRSSHQIFVLTTEKGLPLLRVWIGANGKKQKADAIKSNYVHLQARTGISKSLKLFRKTSATLLGGNKHYVLFTGHFLGHAPRGVEEESYRRPSETLFDEAINWLGQQYGFVDKA
jgi:integrase